MSEAVRNALAQGASTVEGITGQPYFVQTTGAGVALVRYDGTEYVHSFGARFGTPRWSVVLLLPNDPAAGEKYLEAKVPPLLDALAPVLAVKSVTPQYIDFGSGAVPCAVISGNREEEEA